MSALCSSSVLYNLDGSVLGLQTMLLDVTELRRARDELIASQEQLRRLALRIQEAREDERIVVARRLHDDFSQKLTALRFDIESLNRHAATSSAAIRLWLHQIRETYDNDAKRRPHDGLNLGPAGREVDIESVSHAAIDASGRLQQRLNSVSALAESMATEIRQVISELRPGMLDDLGLRAAIEWQAEQFSERTGIPCTLSSDAEEHILPPSVTTALFRVLQELLNNVTQHAQASAVRIDLESTPDAIRLVVSDNGRGMAEQELSGADSLGLLGIRERVRVCGGTVDFESGPGQGTTVTAVLPIQDQTGDAWQARLGGFR